MMPSLAKSPSARKRFLQEARSAAKIQHDHIVSIFQVGEDQDIPFLAMQLLEGMSLADLLKQQPILKTPQIV
jgi:serine/threonine protein kinase